MVPLDRYIDTFAHVARHRLALQPWHDIEPALAETWEQLREPGSPGWEDVAPLVRSEASSAANDAG
ncbi:hypothetical protein [Agrilutibacter solisilvae]|uniref:Uncharacterized protein n=1 Tax=Agrilutibacter solisilvae TaxID=2763317 RepID=A0A974XY72_9GAMM|nr:hypothetical protein [Lysobacter solisilvae]QSX77803.1 hypothetical protein I8J32_013880 [Lysobacter solisilvae]